MDDDIKERFKVQRQRTTESSSPKAAELPQRSKPVKKSRKWLKSSWVNLARLLVLALILASSLWTWHYFKDRAKPIPNNVRQSVSFPLYYPSSLPDGYSLDKGSIKVEGQIIFYLIASGSKKISISEQVVPNPAPDIKNVQGNSSIKKIDTSFGKAILGLYRGAPVAIMLTKTTLINMNASSDVPTDLISKIVQNMYPL